MIKPSTILFISLTILIFMVMQILLFWFVLSKSLESIVIDKSHMISDMIANSTILKHRFEDYIKSEEYISMYNNSIRDSEKRYNTNVEVTWKWMFIPVLICVVIIFLSVVYTSYVHNKLDDDELKMDRTDVLNLTMVVFSFLIEVVIIYVLILRYIYISDIDVLLYFISFAKNNEILGPVIGSIPLSIIP